MTDIVFLSVPKLQLKGPILSIHLLKACVIQAGFSAKALDFNAWFANQVKGTSLYECWTNPDNKILTDRHAIKSIEDQYEMVWEMFWEEKIEKLDPKIIGICAFSEWTLPNIGLISKWIRAKNPNIKILVGGPCLKHQRAVQYLQPLIDDFITGDAELSIVEYLKGNMTYPGINVMPESAGNWKDGNLLGSFGSHDNNFDRNDIPPPDYDDLDKSLYHNNKPLYSICGSRGCVRRCAFCNVPAIWPKFMFRGGKIIADEMIYLYEKYGGHKFLFTDSLINGNLKEFYVLLKELCAYKKRNPKADFKFMGQFITREKNQISDDMFDLMRDAGYDHVTTGIESGSEKLRKEMNKNFSNDAIEYHLQQLQRVGMTMVPLMFVGFPTETEDDFQETIKLMDMFQKYPDVVKYVTTDHPMIIVKNSPVYINKDEFHIREFQDGNYWVSDFSTRKLRIERHYKFLDEIDKRGLWERKRHLISSRTHTMAEEYMQYENLDQEVVDIINSWYQ